MYLSPQDNKLAAQGALTRYDGYVSKGSPTLWNLEGRAVVDHKHFMASVIALTVKKTRGVEVNVVQALLQLPYMIYTEVVDYSRWVWENRIMCHINEAERVVDQDQRKIWDAIYSTI